MMLILFGGKWSLESNIYVGKNKEKWNNEWTENYGMIN